MIGEHQIVGETGEQAAHSGSRWGLEPRLLAVLIFLLVVLAGLGGAKIWLASAGAPPPEAPVPTATAEPEPMSDDSPTGLLVVYVSGAVQNPGVVEMTEGQRVVDALEAAGGPTDAAALESLNLARPLVDGEQLHLPEKTEGAAPGAGGPPGGAAPPGQDCVDLNNSTEDQLQTLVGIGPALAERIVQHRESAGPFEGKDSLMEVSGIGPKIFAGLEADLCG